MTSISREKTHFLKICFSGFSSETYASIIKICFWYYSKYSFRFFLLIGTISYVNPQWISFKILLRIHCGILLSLTPGITSEIPPLTVSAIPPKNLSRIYQQNAKPSRSSWSDFFLPILLQFNPRFSFQNSSNNFLVMLPLISWDFFRNCRSGLFLDFNWEFL